MKTILALALALSLGTAHAALWVLSSSGYVSGTTFACTYTAGTYSMTIVHNGTCPAYINR